jgi:hypothetical protein
MVEVFNQYENLKGFFREVEEICGRAISEELIYILAGLLESKLNRLQSLEECEIDDVIPKMERFWGDDDD